MHRSELIESLESRRLLTTYYLDAAAGNNANSGTSTGAAWQTIGQIAMKSFKAGDNILLKGGQTFYGKLYLSSDDKGTSTSPITVSSYGTGRATINGGNDSGIYINNTAGIDINKLNLVGNGYSVNKGGGIYAYNSSSTKLKRIHISEVDVKGFRNGIAVGGTGSTSGFKEVWVYSAAVHDNGNAGIFTFASSANVHEDIYIGHVQAYNNFGYTNNDTTNNGHGIMLGSVRRATIERSVAHDNGSKGNGGAGMWAYDSTEVLFQYNESYNNKTATSHDGDGFDFDQNTSNSLMQYNYSHGNDGAGFLMATKFNNSSHHDNVIRYNISVNDCRKLDYGALHIWGKVVKAEWYNNTVYLAPKSGSSASRYGIKVINDFIESQDTSSVHFRNNIIQTTGGMTLVYVSSGQTNGSTDLKFQGNDYYSSGSAFKINYGGTTYSSLSSWQSGKSQEKNGSTLTGMSVNPNLVSAGTVTTLGNADKLNTLGSYKLSSSSPLINHGLSLSSFGVSVGGHDFWGTGIPTGGKFEIGADEV